MQARWWTFIASIVCCVSSPSIQASSSLSASSLRPYTLFVFGEFPGTDPQCNSPTTTDFSPKHTQHKRKEQHAGSQQGVSA